MASNTKEEEKLSFLRFQSQFRLKSAWDRICHKYGRSFAGVTDEIDLETEQVVVDCGFVRNTPTKQFGSSYVPPVDKQLVNEAWSSPVCRKAFEETGRIIPTPQKDRGYVSDPQMEPRGSPEGVRERKPLVDFSNIDMSNNDPLTTPCRIIRTRRPQTNVRPVRQAPRHAVRNPHIPQVIYRETFHRGNNYPHYEHRNTGHKDWADRHDYDDDEIGQDQFDDAHNRQYAYKTQVMKPYDSRNNYREIPNREARNHFSEPRHTQARQARQASYHRNTSCSPSQAAYVHTRPEMSTPRGDGSRFDGERMLMYPVQPRQTYRTSAPQPYRINKPQTRSAVPMRAHHHEHDDEYFIKPVQTEPRHKMFHRQGWSGYNKYQSQIHYSSDYSPTRYLQERRMAAAQSALRTIHVASPQSRQQFSQIANVVEYDYGSSDSEDQLTTDDKPISHFPLVLKIEKSLPQNGQIDDLVSSVNCVLPNWMEPLKSDEDVEKDIVPAPQPAVPLTEMPSKYHVSGISDVLPSSNDQPASVEQDPPIVPEAAEVEDFIIDENADPTNTLLQDDVQEPTVPWTPLKRKRTQVQSSHTPLKWLDLRSRDLASAEEESTELSPKTAGNVDELEIIETNAVAWTPRKKATNTPSKLKWQLLSSKKEFAKLDLELMSSSSLLVEFEQTIPAVEDATPLALLDGNAENTDDLVNVSSEHDDNATATSSREPAQEPVSVTVLLQGANEGDDNAPQDISISV